MRLDLRRGRGLSGEGLAFGYLFALGYRPRERNWRTRLGEVDLVMEDGPAIVFVEVKTRRGLGFGDGFAAVAGRKRARLRRLAEAYMRHHPDRACRIDVVSVTIVRGRPTIAHLVGAC